MDNKYKVIVVDDHELFRLGVCSALQVAPNMEVIAEADSGNRLLALLEQGLHPDIIVLDVIMPGINGLEVAKNIKHKYFGIKIILLSSENSDDIINKAIKIGVDGFISKLDAGKELVTAINRIMQYDEPYYGQSIAKIMYEILIANKVNQPRGASKLFSERELEVITACAKGMTAKETAEKLFISKRTVDWHRNNIFKKLGINNNLELVKYALKHEIVKL